MKDPPPSSDILQICVHQHYYQQIQINCLSGNLYSLTWTSNTSVTFFKVQSAHTLEFI